MVVVIFESRVHVKMHVQVHVYRCFHTCLKKIIEELSCRVEKKEVGQKNALLLFSCLCTTIYYNCGTRDWCQMQFYTLFAGEPPEIISSLVQCWHEKYMSRLLIPRLQLCYKCMKPLILVRFDAFTVATNRIKLYN